MSIYQNKVNKKKLSLIREAFFIMNNDIVDVIDPALGLQGNKIIDNKFNFAVWAGPEADLFNLTHEMAHFLEIDEARMCYPNWNLGLGKWNDRLCMREGMYTNKAIEREIRVFGIQHVLNEYFKTHYGRENPFNYSAKLCNWIDGMYHYYPRDWRTTEIGLDACKKHAYKVIAARIKEESMKWTMEKILALWNERIAKLRVMRDNGCWKEYEEYPVRTRAKRQA